MARPKDKENDILAAAAELFIEKGFSDTNIKDIAERAGIGKGTIYEYFRSKEELFVEAIRQDISEIMSQVKHSISDEENFLTKLKTFIDVSVDMRDKNYKRIEFYITRNIAALNPDTLDSFKVLDDEITSNTIVLLSDIIEQGIREGLIDEADTEFCAFIIMGMIGAYCRKGKDNEISMEQKENEKRKLLNMIMNGIGT